MPEKPADPWKLRKHARSNYYRVRFSHAGVRYEESTGTSNLEEAQERAARFYAKVVSGQHRPAVRLIVGADSPLDEVGAEWLAAIGYDSEPWVLYLRHWWRHFGTVGALVAEGGIEKYWVARLLVVKRKTVEKETGAMKDLLAWLKENEYLGAPVEVPKLPTKNRKVNQGVPYCVRRRGKATELSAEQARAIIAELPEWSKREPSFPVRARFELMLETGLRPRTLSLLTVPRHYHQGSETLLITADIDKNEFERRVPLTDAARVALDSVCPKAGVIFGKHDFRALLDKAVEAAKLPAHLAATFCAYDLKHRAATEMASTGDLPGAAFLMGWTQVTTANKYAHPERAAAERVLDARASALAHRAATKAAQGAAVIPPLPAAPIAATEPPATPPGVLAWGTRPVGVPFSAGPSVEDSNDSAVVRGRGLEPPRPLGHQNLNPTEAGFCDVFGVSESARTPLNTPESTPGGVLPQALPVSPDLASIAIRILSANALGEPISRDQEQALARGALLATDLGRLALEVLDGGPRATAAAVQLAANISVAASLADARKRRDENGSGK
jgi:integrase